MAKGQQRGNREIRKSKQDKPLLKPERQFGNSTASNDTSRGKDET